MTLRTVLRTQGAYIIMIVVIFFTLLTLFSILGVTFTPVEDKHIQKVVTIESFDSDFSDGLCEKHSDEPHEIEEKCKALTDGDKDIDVAYYHHKNTCTGDCPNVEGFTASSSPSAYYVTLTPAPYPTTPVTVPVELLCMVEW